MDIQVHRHQQWPSGDSRPLVSLRFSPDELTRRYGLDFEVLHDDLDFFTLAAIRLPDGSQVWLERHDGYPFHHTLAHVDAEANFRWAKEGLMKVLELTEEDLDWVSPLVSEAE